MYKYRVNIEFKGIGYSIPIESDFPLIGDQIKPLISTYMRQNKGIDISMGYEIRSINPEIDNKFNH